MSGGKALGDAMRGIVVGAGYFGRNWMRLIGGRKDCRLAGLVAADPESLQGALAEHVGSSRVVGYGDLDEALARERPDFAVVAVPESAHRVVVCRLLAAGVHTLCEKPLAMTREDAQAIGAAHRAHPAVRLMIDQNFRWRPSVQTLHAQVRAGAVGDLGELSIVHRQNITRGTVGGWRETMAQPYLFDMAVHFFDLVRYLSGLEAERMYARTYRPAWSMFKGAPAIWAEASLTGGVHAEVTGTFSARGFETVQEGMITLTGSGGTLRYGEDRRVRLYRDGKSDEIPMLPMAETDCVYTLSHFLECLRNGARPVTDLDDNLRTFSMVLAALESDGSAQRVAVERL